MKKRNIVVLLLILLFLLIFTTACEKKEEKNSEGTKVDTKEVKTNDEDTSKKLSFVCDENKKIKIETPNSWTEYDQGKMNDDTCIELRGTERDKYLLVISEEKSKFDSYNAWLDIVYGTAKKSYGLEDSNLRRSDEGGLNTRFIDKEIEDEDGTVMYLQLYFMETNNYYNQVLIWCDASDKSLYSSEFRDIAFTLKEIG